MRPIALAVWIALPLAAATPPCRLDRANAPAVEAAARQVSGAYARTGQDLPFDRVVVNAAAAQAERVLRIEILADTPAPCSVQGLCQAAGGGELLVRCSSRGIATLLGKAEAHPALAYVLGHEIAHLARRDQGHFLSAVAEVPLRGTRAERLRVLQDGCEADGQLPEEETADAMALAALAAVVSERPFRQPMLNARGSLYWNVDEILLAAKRFDESRGEKPADVHPLFDMDRRPSRSDEPFFDWAARRFVCDALNACRPVRYPLRATTHPAPEERLRRIAGRIESIARGTADDDTAAEYQRRVGAETAMQLQEHLGAIFNRMIEDNGAYLAALHSRVCSIANLDARGLDCARISPEPPAEPEDGSRPPGNSATEQPSNSDRQVVQR